MEEQKTPQAELRKCEDKVGDLRQRIRQLLQETHMSVNRLAGGNPSLQRKLHRQINEDVSITSDSLLWLLEAYEGLSAEWLMQGKGVPFPESDNSPSIDINDAIPLISVEASANLDTLRISDDGDDIEGHIYIPGVPRCDGAVHVRGDSMYPVLQSGDIIGFKRLPVTMESIFFGEMYLLSIDVDGDRYVTVKYIHRSDLGPQYIKLVSANEHHQSKDVHVNNIRALALVKFTVRANSMF